MNEPAEAVVEDTSPVDIPAPVDWKEEIPSDIRDGLGDVDNVSDLAKGYVSAQQMIGNSIRIPSKEAGTEDWDKFYGKFSDVPGLTRYNPDDLNSLYDAAGRPKDSKGYNVDGADEGFLEVAHAAGLNRSQVEALMAFDKSNDDASAESENQTINGGINSLKQEWGLAFDGKIAEGQNAVAFLEQSVPGLSEALNATGAGNHPAMIKLFQSLGSNLKEGEGFAGSSQSGSSLTPTEAKAQIAEIQNNPAHPFNEGDEAATEHMLELHKFAFPEVE